MLRAVSDRGLDELLSRVSRSFYLSLAILPRAVRPQIAAAYLVARAADTIADTGAVPAARRRELLAELRAVIEGEASATTLGAAVRRELGPPIGDGKGGAAEAERVLLDHLEDCLALVLNMGGDDRVRTERVLGALLTGMERDLERFVAKRPADGTPHALATLAELDEHCYFAAGCVGEYWTEMTAAHLPAVAHLADAESVERGVRLGKALQLVNVLRDAPADLADGRCYLPAELLARHGLSPADLGDPRLRRSARFAVEDLIRLALDHVDAAWPYVLAIPRSAPRLRLACVWPLWIGLGTLARIADVSGEDPLAPGRRIKVPRTDVYRLIATSVSSVLIDSLLDRQHRRLRDAVTHATAGWGSFKGASARGARGR